MTSPFGQGLQATVPAQTIAAEADQIVGEAPYSGTVTEVTFTPEANVVGDDDDTRTLTLINKGQDGNGTTVVATLALVTGVSLTDFNEQAFTLSVVANATRVAAGDILALAETVAGDGLVNPGGRVSVTINRAYS